MEYKIYLWEDHTHVATIYQTQIGWILYNRTMHTAPVFLTEGELRQEMMRIYGEDICV